MLGTSVGLIVSLVAAWVVLPGSSQSREQTAVQTAANRALRQGYGIGVRFSNSVDTRIAGTRFVLGSQGTGPVVASLWTGDGALLARATTTLIAGRTWQRVTFGNPVALTKKAPYVLSFWRRGNPAPAASVARIPVGRAPTVTAAGVLYGRGSGFPRRAATIPDYPLVPVVSVTAPSPVPTTQPPSPTTTTPAPIPTTTTPTSTTSSTPVPTSAGDCRAKVWSKLEACGWAGPANTGPAAGTQASRTVTGGYTVTSDNAVIDGWQVSGGIRVEARNVTIRNSWVSNSAGGRSGSGVVNVTPGGSATIEQSVLDGRNATHACVWHEGSQLTARHNECTGVNDGMFSWATKEGVDGTGDNFTIADNYFHGFTTQAGNGHVDGWQTEGAKNGVLRHNTFDVTQDQTSAIAIWNDRKSSSNIVVDRNLIAGGGFSVYAEDYSPSEASPAGGYSVTDIQLTDNVFSTVHYGCVGYWGVWFPRGAPTDGWNRSGNTVLETGQRIDGGNPTRNGTPCN